MTIPFGPSLPIRLDGYRASQVAERFEANQITRIFRRYTWLNDMANGTKAAAEQHGWDESDYISNACGLAVGGLVLDDQGVNLNSTPIDRGVAVVMLGTSMGLRDGVIIGEDGNSFGRAFQNRNPEYVDAIEPVNQRVAGDMFISGATLTFLVAEAIQRRQAHEAVTFN